MTENTEQLLRLSQSIEYNRLARQKNKIANIVLIASIVLFGVSIVTFALALFPLYGGR